MEAEVVAIQEQEVECTKYIVIQEAGIQDQVNESGNNEGGVVQMK